VSPLQRAVVVGASYAGLRAAESLRRSGFTGELVIVGAEPHHPYDRPSLTKGVLFGATGHDAIALPLPASLGEVAWRLGSTVTTSDLAGHRLTLDDGTDLEWDGLVVATGLRSKHLPLAWEPPRLAVRSLDDSERLRAAMHRALQSGRRMVVIGAGFIGCEVAAVGAQLGLHVTVVAPEAVPLLRPLGEQLGTALQRRHEAFGVTFCLGLVPLSVLGDADSARVRLSDGQELEAELVVEAVGSTPVVEWLQGNDVELSNGVPADESLQVLSGTTSEPVPGVVVCGDVALFANPLFDGVPRRVEHWTMAADTGKRAGRTLGLQLTGASPEAKPFAPVPTFWTEQLELRLQSFGLPDLGDDVRVLEGSLDLGQSADTLPRGDRGPGGSSGPGGDGEPGVVVGYHRDGMLMGVVMTGFEHRYRHYRTAIGQPGHRTS
jgi:NADPH-dependent 2,4-dienoyl-CoA reductase/sulfur reductase-like enzyme